jgi:protein tyrosine/serine phosphatase
MKWLKQYLKSLGRNYGGTADGLFYRGARPDEEFLKELKRVGVRTIINLIGDDTKGVIEDIDLAFRIIPGVEYIHIPLSDKAPPTEEQLNEFLHYTEALPKPIFLHCKGGRHRTGIMWAVLRERRYGWTKRKCVEEMERYGWYSTWGHQPLLDWFRELGE